ncbi:MAG TPA: hypothetical protein VI564_06455 [Candidatus Nanoarchaeia archaeon]|nr:hypothetical protein [Candidatus Nanoarchaeia archaeon]
MEENSVKNISQDISESINRQKKEYFFDLFNFFGRGGTNGGWTN